MSNFTILRTQKLKSTAAVHRSMKHAFREQETPNADAGKLTENTHIGANNVKEGMQAFRDALPEKIRKNAVLAVEYLITASPEAMQGKSREEQDNYFKDSLEWLRQKHGAENVVYAGIHRDETTPHMYAYVTPKIDGKLNCRAFLGGAKALSDMQSEFSSVVGKKHGLERGLQGSKARHTSIKKYYANVNEAEIKTIRITSDDMQPKTVGRTLGVLPVKETTEQVVKRIGQSIKKQIEPVFSKAQEAKRISVENERLNRKVVELEQERKQFLGGLDKENVEKLKKQASVMRENQPTLMEKIRQKTAKKATDKAKGWSR